MKTKTEAIREAFLVLIAAALIATVIIFTAGCAGPKTLQPGGAYAPTNAAGEMIVNERGLALADASYKFAYETAISTFRFERDNRAEIYRLSPTLGPKIKAALDDGRGRVWDIDQRWARARKAYRENPTPAGLTALQTALAEIERLIPVIQSQIQPVYRLLAQPTP